MKLTWICGVLFAIALSIPASAQISVYIGSAPPPLRYERRAPIPAPGYVWIEGYWAPDGHHYRWVAGTGSVRRTRARIGTIPITITIVKAGDGMKATGIVRITTGITDATVTRSTTIIEHGSRITDR